MIAERLSFDNPALKNKDSRELGLWIRKFVEKYGYLRLRDARLGENLEHSKILFCEFCSSIGTLVPHNPGKEDFVWEIKPNFSNSVIKTFSEHNQKAPLHTDSQYRKNPEKLIALVTLNQAQCGGGCTELVDFVKIRQDLNRTHFGRGVIDFFRNKSFPIAVPSVFQKFSAPTYIKSKLISDRPLIRYRYDTLKAGLSLCTSDEHKIALYRQKLDLLDSLIQASPHRIRFLLSSNEVMILDNHRFLHGRSSFSDSQRLLLRCRMN